jgi:hypothetical protein
MAAVTPDDLEQVAALLDDALTRVQDLQEKTKAPDKPSLKQVGARIPDATYRQLKAQRVVTGAVGGRLDGQP